MSNSKERLHELNWLRAVACLCIILYHYTTRYGESYRHCEVHTLNVYWGCGAVNVFFLLTGFLTALHIDRKNFRSYVKGRFLRLFPDYWCCILLTTLFTACLFPQLTRPWSTILVNFSMCQSFFLTKSVDGAYWTLSYELMFSVLIALVLLLRIGTIKTLIKISWFWLAASLVSYWFMEIEQGNQDAIARLAHYILGLFVMYRCSAPFIVGVALCGIYKNVTDKSSSLLLLSGGILSWYVQTKVYFVCLLVSTLLILLIITLRNRQTTKYADYVEYANKTFMVPFDWIAQISYPLYLLHQFVGYSIIKNLETHFGSGSIWLLTIPFGVCAALAWIVNRIIDRKLVVKFVLPNK